MTLEPPRDCRLCPRLAAFRDENAENYPDFYNGPVPSFGKSDARLLIVGLAPGLKGANRTGRPFTGDYAGDLLYKMLLKHGLATGRYEQRPDDGMKLTGCTITNAVRCVPPENKPLPYETKTCRRFLIAQIEAMQNLRAILTLGKVSHDSVCDTLGLKKSQYPFKHGAAYKVDDVTLVSSYHCSRYNTNTGVLTEAMFESVIKLAKKAALG
ncbi:uracil-DNA glycosylase family 4 [Rhizomicrobium palustre]|uniref:Type-5 uracil-DNA glycosylase n=1 Tax=Rhizomicrobium palustre TaxID=189966 RepID=A0A846N572_9PROT|nr:uracil-DNA glycosylase [Rhizomicrobium palustre]NIK90341.1 uracil-DNA glycosylase family 4 [Rhizomicrobium palustre]